MSAPEQPQIDEDRRTEVDEGSGVAGEVPAPQTSTEALRLGEVAELLGVSRRKIQYLRERGTVVPSAGGSGRGNAGRYTPEDVRQIKLILGLRGLEEPIIQQIAGEVDWDRDDHAHPLSPEVCVIVDLDKLR